MIPLPLSIDVQNRVLIAGSALPPQVYFGDTLDLVLSFFTPGSTAPTVYTPLDLSATTITAQIGVVAGRPYIGNFTLTDPSASQTTSSTPWNSSAFNIQSVIDVGLTTNWQTATVTGPNNGPWVVTNGANGALTLLTGASVSLEPTTSVQVTRLQAGTSAQPEIQLIQLVEQAFAVSGSFTAGSGTPPVMTGTLTLSSAALLQMLCRFLSNTFSLQILSVDASNNQQTLFQGQIKIGASVSTAITGVPMPSNSGVVAIASGASSVTVTGLGRATAPTAILVSLMKPFGGLDMSVDVDSSTITTGGFTAYLSGVTDSANYKLVYSIVA
jgi:hypothetical protein